MEKTLPYPLLQFLINQKEIRYYGTYTDKCKSEMQALAGTFSTRKIFHMEIQAQLWFCYVDTKLTCITDMDLWIEKQSA